MSRESLLASPAPRDAASASEDAPYSQHFSQQAAGGSAGLEDTAVPWRPVDPADAAAEDTGQGSPSGVRVLLNRSKLSHAMKELPGFSRIVIVEDNQRDSDRLASTLRAIFGYDTVVRQCKTLGTALDAVLADQPEIVFLDDRLGPIDKAEKSVPFLRTAQSIAMIIVVSSYVDRRRRAEIIKLGVDEVIDKDELDSTSICQAILNAQVRRQQ